jgi:hypothetical protein
MIQNRNLLFILGCFLFLVTNISVGQEKVNIKKAMVESYEAIIYSDPLLKNPIGKVSKSTLISVGKATLNNPQVVPIIVAGEVAYIQLKDLIVDDPKNPTFHDTSILFAKPPENLLKNNSVYLDAHQLLPGEEITSIFKNRDQVSYTSMNGISAAVYHRQSSSLFLWGVGLEYFYKSSTNANYSFMMFNPTFGFSPFKNRLFNLDLLFSFDFSTGSNFVVLNNYNLENGGFIYGPNFGARMVFFSSSKYKLTASMSYRLYRIIGASEYTDEKDVIYPAPTKISGLNLAAGISFDI